MRLWQGLVSLLLCVQLLQPAFATEYTYHSPLNLTHNQEREQMMGGDPYDLLSKSVYLLAYQTVVIYGLTRVPSDWTKWDPERVQVKHWLRNWHENVTHKPVRDEDPFLVNYFGHPVTGMGYYVMARQTGYDPVSSFLYTLFESTFVWEYGVESFVEEPSIQDLWITPLVGSLWGEINYRLVQKIEEDDGLVYGSKGLGSFCLLLLSPFNQTVVWTRDLLRGGEYYHPSSYSYWSIQPTHQPGDVGRHHGQQVVLSWVTQF